MVLKPLGEKVVNILVNGTQEASYTQDKTENDYDISVDAVAEQSKIAIADQLTWSTDQTLSKTIYEFSNDGNSSIDVVGNMGTTDSSGYILEIRKNGSAIAGGDDTVPSEQTITVNVGDRLSFYAERKDQNLGSPEDYWASATILHTGSAHLNINGVTQS